MFFRSKLRVAINAQLMPEHGNGGILTVLKALAEVAHLSGKSEQYVFVGPNADPNWLRAYLPAEAMIVRGPPPEGYTSYPASPFLHPIWRRRGHLKASLSGFFDSLEADVVHFPFQRFELCRTPIVFNPHDLQHLHYPEFFSTAEYDFRENLYRSACDAAAIVVAGSTFVKNDLIHRYNLDPKKIRTISWAPPSVPKSARQSELVELAQLYRLPATPFAIYPAMTWEHKNHIRLLEAFARFKQRSDVPLSLVCTGKKTDFWPQIEKRIFELRLTESIVFPDLVPDKHLHALYSFAQFTIVPSLFEAASGPMFESWQHATPVACSAVTSLPAQAADAALLFDPLSVDDIANAISRMATDADLRHDLRAKGVERLKAFDIGRTARAYRAVYRLAAGRRLNREDSDLLNATPPL